MLQGVRMGETSTSTGSINMQQGLKIRVEDRCDLADPCDSNICPENSQCLDEWGTHTCVCDSGTNLSTVTNHTRSDSSFFHVTNLLLVRITVGPVSTGNIFFLLLSHYFITISLYCHCLLVLLLFLLLLVYLILLL